jgi:lysophospholipase L1-like esterase
VKWSIALTEFNDVNLANVARITIGFGDGNSPGDEGTVYFEDIQILNQTEEGLPELPEVKGDWIGTWATGQQLVEPGNVPASPGLANNTLRQIVHATLGGSIIRVHFSNKYTTSGGPVTINSAHIARTANSSPVDSAIITSTDTTLTFNGGLPSVTIPAGEEIYSDPVDFNVPPLSDLTVSIYFGSASSTNVTGHPGSRTSYYIKTGNTVSDAEMESGYKANHWYVISRIDVLLDDSYGDVVILGDSITDGRGCTDNYNNRWPDLFAARLHADPATAKVGVINQGIGGNALYGGLGPSALSRFDHDVLEQPGVRWAIIFEGVNDICSLNRSAADIISAYQTFIAKAHAAGLLIYGATITPFKGNDYYSVDHEAVRDAVNDWIRTSGQFDAVIDLDAAMRDPSDEDQLNPAYQYEWLHFNPTGMQAAADSVDLDLFKLTADLNEDGIVNLVDFAILAGQWLQAPGSPSADIVPLQGGDGAVDFEDLHLMTLQWLIEE